MAKKIKPKGSSRGGGMMGMGGPGGGGGMMAKIQRMQQEVVAELHRAAGITDRERWRGQRRRGDRRHTARCDAVRRAHEERRRRHPVEHRGASGARGRPTRAASH